MSAHTNSLILGSRSIRDLINHHQNLKLLVREFKVFWKETLGKINPNGKKLLCTKGLIDLGVALGTSFINILIWRKTQSIPLIVLYNITFYPHSQKTAVVRPWMNAGLLLRRILLRRRRWGYRGRKSAELHSKLLWLRHFACMRNLSHLNQRCNMT